MAEGAAGTVDIPKLGKVKKVYFWGAIGVVALYVGYRWYASQTAGASDGVDYTTGDVGEGLEASGVVGAGGVSGNNQYAGTVTDGTDDDAINTNAQWTQRAAEILANAGMDPATVYAALGEFLARRPLDDAEASIARAAMAAAGQPPEGRPWTIVPQVGEVTLGAPSGLKATGTTTNSVSLSWSGVANAAKYEVYQGSASAGSTSSTSMTVSGLTANTSYTFQVAAVATTGKAGPKSLAVSATTAKPTTTTPPTTTPPTKPPTTKPRYRTLRITRRGQTLSDLVAEYNRRYGTKHTVASIWSYNLANRPAATVKTLKSRGPNKVFIGSSFWFPY
jgi:hypothetical protein